MTRARKQSQRLAGKTPWLRWRTAGGRACVEVDAKRKCRRAQGEQSPGEPFRTWVKFHVGRSQAQA